MSIWQSIQDAIGFNFGEIGTATLVVGVFAVFMMFILGCILVSIAGFALKANFYPKWLGVFSLGITGVMALLWVFIPGWPTMSTLGLVVGLGLIIAAVLVYRSGFGQSIKSSAYLTLVIGALDIVVALIVTMVELYGGGGFLG
jgi:hypothetical protein